MLSIAGRDKTGEVIEVALGRRAADLALVGGTLLNVYTGELLEGRTLLIKGEWIAHVGTPPEGAMGSGTNVIDLEGKIIIPGLIDGHTHLSDQLCCPAEFLRHAMKGGTTTIITETIEPYPVCGIGGVLDFLASLADQPIKIFATAPAMASTSPRSHGIRQEDLDILLRREDILGLGEAYWQSVIQDPETFLPRFEEALLSGRLLEGHTAGAKNGPLSAYVACGISSCHEPITAEEALERLRFGLYVMVREGSIRRDLRAISSLKDAGVDLGRVLLVTDGVGPLDLLESGYMEAVVQKAIDCGINPIRAIQMATIHPAAYFHLDGLIGGIAPGRQADLVVIPALERIKAEMVISRGRIIGREGRLLAPPRSHAFSKESLNSIHLSRRLQPQDFRIDVQRKGVKRVTVRVIDMVTELVTREAVLSVPVREGEIRCDPERDLLKVAAVDRRSGDGKSFVGLIRGFGMKSGAFACSGAWDTADIIVVGADEEDMAGAVNRVSELHGGAVLVVGGRVRVEIPLPVFGLMTDLPVPEAAARMERLRTAMKDLGFPYKDPYRTLATLTGAAIPFIRICEGGLVNIKTGERVSLIL
ncbi:MAG: adenine deaminase [Deltaproteobacteria bacterium]|nr:adenine deaminase [Deltaproteobacteria bacterium]